MSLLGRLLGKPDPGQTEVRALWHRAVEIAREPHWYAQGGIADTVSGRFDAITLVMALIMLRMDDQPDLRAPAARLTELFVSDMDGQLRQSGVGDLVVGKQVGKLMGALGGRMDALRAALRCEDDAELVAVIERNVTFGENPRPAEVASRLRTLAHNLATLTNPDFLAGRIDR